MASIGHHLIIKLRDGRVIAPAPPQRRRAITNVLRICAEHRLTIAHLVDSHLHLQLLESRRTTLKLARSIEVSLSRSLELPVSFQPAYAEPIRSQGHLYNTFDYILRQQSRHGLSWDPTFDCSSISDLLGLRICGAYTISIVNAHLPRIRQAKLLGYMGLESLGLRDGPIQLLPAATMAAAGISTLTRPHTGFARSALRGAVRIAGDNHSMAEVARALAISERTVYRYQQQKADDNVVAAIRRQLYLRSVVHQKAGSTTLGQTPSLEEGARRRA